MYSLMNFDKYVHHHLDIEYLYPFKEFPPASLNQAPTPTLPSAPGNHSFVFCHHALVLVLIFLQFHINKLYKMNL